MNKLSLTKLVLLFPLILVGCGGGGSDSPASVVPDPVVPDPVVPDPVVPDPIVPDPVVPDPVETVGFFTEPRFTLSAQACIASLSDKALIVDDGFDESTLVSSDLSCTQSNDGNNLIYNISWTGSDFNRDDEKDTLTFDVRVEAFTDSTFSYSELAGQSSMTALGTSSTFNQLIDDDNADVSFWDIDGDTGEGIAEGQSLRFSIENVDVSLNNYRVVFNGFNAINVDESNAGNSHKHIRGEGTGLDSGITNGIEKFIFDPFDTFVITGAGDSNSTRVWGITDIQFSFSIDNPDLESENSAEWLAGSWGVTYPVFGGERLDQEMIDNNYDYRAGAQEVVDELPSVGHIMTNLSYFAHSHYFTLRGNTNVDVANEIHESLVPTLENEQIILDVLQKFKDADKRVILYISTNYLFRADDEVKAAWEAYYNTNFAGDEYLAYENLIQGFIERFKDYADGYWLDTTTLLNADGKLEDFIHMIKQTDPTSIVTANEDKNYFSENDAFLFVDSDGIDDTDESDYRIVLHEPLNTFQDFTNGHVTPLSTGAPPNSWGYEEYTLPNMINEPWVSYNGKTTLKHAWFPVRELWHSPRQPLVFGVEQAYRFVKSVTDGEASITFATTNADHTTPSVPGYLMQDEMDIMKEINARLMMETPPAHEVYVRPEGASLVITE